MEDLGTKVTHNDLPIDWVGTIGRINIDAWKDSQILAAISKFHFQGPELVIFVLRMLGFMTKLSYSFGDVDVREREIPYSFSTLYGLNKYMSSFLRVNS